MSTPATAIAPQDQPNGGTLSLPSRYATFGTFQADLEAGELFQNGQRVKVQTKVFQALLLLLSRAGEIVTREDVRLHLWPDTLLTNLDANVNTTMNKLRIVLGDSPESPTYIETIPRRGYSFVASIEFSRDPLAQLAPPVESPSETNSQTVSAQQLRTRIRLFLRLVGILFAGMILGALLAFVWFFAQSKNQRAGASTKVTAALLTAEPQRKLS
jgi:DNA-binding winged helix-turn-helix (wHTH) protein